MNSFYPVCNEEGNLREIRICYKFDREGTSVEECR